ncbi:P-loop containing nucleoside triphosphate hydrolase protein [Calocera cornea HHB12733]|uniref:p-loop containing nucleoside triphosphate hydrolase protein n=1 Tax=Calocera cornea HHB12733 TaxID=1353952 RepID=A0A165DLV1_9BASI|nr:P-loop containing nucleoside triphosphate hydrolase protein [Calocera cornea HHB12733]
MPIPVDVAASETPSENSPSPAVIAIAAKKPELNGILPHANGINGVHANPVAAHPVDPTALAASAAPVEEAAAATDLKPSDDSPKVEGDSTSSPREEGAEKDEKDAEVKDGEKAEEDKPKEPEFPPGCRAELKRVDEVYDKDAGEWVVRDAAPVSAEDKADKYREFCFTVYRKFNSDNTDSFTLIHIKSPFLKKVGKAVIGNIPGVSWNPAVIDPQILLAWLPFLRTHLDTLKAKEEPTEDEKTTTIHLTILVEFLDTEYQSTLEQVNGLVPHGEITFELLWAILLPRTLMYTSCSTTDQSRAVELVGAEMHTPWPSPHYWELDCRYVDSCASLSDEHAKFGHAQMTIRIPMFKGSAKITSLSAYPMKFHSRQDELRTKLIARGKRWVELEGMHHLAYDGVAFKFVQAKKARIKGRVMIDKKTFKRINANYPIPSVEGSKDSEEDSYGYRRNDSDCGDDDEDEREETLLVDELNDDQLMLTTPIVYGFSLVDKVWLEFNVDHVKEITWNDAAFSNLVLPPAQKELIQSLVEAHSQNEKFDDFIEGKGQGLIFNLYGPPGIGKTMSAEATSEHVRRPLYVVKSSDLGIQAEQLDAAITEVFDIAHTWGAVVLLDEADVYMEERSVHDLARNALVAVFLRQLEYFRGILFLTTNRVKTFDEAFQSRIHVSLRFKDLDRVAKKKIWLAFLVKVGLEEGDFNAGQWEALSLKKINGRQIKNCVRTAQALATSKKERLDYKHLLQVLTIMDQFEQDFNHPIGGEVQFYN